MTAIVCDREELTNSHLEKARRRLQIVSGQAIQIAPSNRSGSLDLTATFGEQTSTNRGEWTFPSISDSVSCHYRELWVPIELGSRTFQFENVHFHLLHHSKDDEAPEEIVAFHWHLRNLDEYSQNRYEHRLHLHFRGLSPVPLRHSHFGATIGTHLADQMSVQDLHELLDDAAKMLAVEVLDRLR